MVKYEIYVTKDHSTVVVDYRLGTDIGQTELIADFSVFVDGKNIIKSCQWLLHIHRLRIGRYR